MEIFCIIILWNYIEKRDKMIIEIIWSRQFKLFGVMVMLHSKEQPIGFFDTGVGGLSVLKKSLELMPEENYIYFGDSFNAPYGAKSTEEVKRLTFKAVEFLLEKGVKAVVIACNTATSAAINDLRERYKELPIIGIEPALKPAIETGKQGKILIMATNVTLKEKKFQALVEKYAKDESINPIIPLPCPGLVEYIERGEVDTPELKSFLSNILMPFKEEKLASVVLGCTHYPFVINSIKDILGESVVLIDGSEGTSRELMRQLIAHDLKRDEEAKGSVKIYNSLNTKVILSLRYCLLELEYNKDDCILADL